MNARLFDKTRSGHEPPRVGALVSWRDLSGRLHDGEVHMRHHEVENGQPWIVVVGSKGEGLVSLTADGEFEEVINP